MNVILKNLFNDGLERKLPKGQIIIYEGDSVEHLYFLDSGYVKVYNILVSGEERIIFMYGPGDAFPLTSYLSDAGVARYFYQCMNDVQIRILPLQDFERKIKNNLDVGEALIRYSYAVNRQFEQRIDILSVNSAMRKVISLLAFLISKTGTPKSSGELGVSLTSQDIADMCGITRETASIQLAQLKKEELITTSRGLRVDLIRLEKLRAKLSIPKF